MRSQIYTYKNITKTYNPESSSTSAQEMFHSRPFVVQSKTAEQPQPQDLKTSFRRAASYGHSLSNIQLSGALSSTVAQPKLETSQPVQCVSDEQKKDDVTKIQSLWRGRAVRKQVHVKREAPGILGTKIHRPSNGKLITNNSPIMNQIKDGATYNRLRVAGGSQSVGVVGTREGEKPEHPATLANNLPQTTAVINGGYFAHKKGLQTDTGQEIEGLGRPIGPTSTRSDHLPIPDPWKKDYGALELGKEREVGVSSGPLLALNGEQRELPNHERLQYQVPSSSGNGNMVDNPLSNRAGALTHSSDPNERAAISTIDDEKKDLIMHTLTANGQRSKGATMQQWQQITNSGAGVKTPHSTVNIDGGGSVFMGVKHSQGQEVKPIARGGDPKKDVRPVANTIASRPVIGEGALPHEGMKSARISEAKAEAPAPERLLGEQES